MALALLALVLVAGHPVLDWAADPRRTDAQAVMVLWVWSVFLGWAWCLASWRIDDVFDREEERP